MKLKIFIFVIKYQVVDTKIKRKKKLMIHIRAHQDEQNLLVFLMKSKRYLKINIRNS